MAFVPHAQSRIKFENKDPLEANVEGVIRANKLTLETIGFGNKTKLDVALMGSGLEGVFVDSQQNKGTVGFRLPK